MIKQQIMIAIGYPSIAIMNPTMNIANGIYNASLTFNALFKYSSFSGFNSSRDFAIKYRIISTIMKSRPYNACGINSLG